jgi:hypothetical protein
MEEVEGIMFASLGERARLSVKGNDNLVVLVPNADQIRHKSAKLTSLAIGDVFWLDHAYYRVDSINEFAINCTRDFLGTSRSFDRRFYSSVVVLKVVRNTLPDTDEFAPYFFMGNSSRSFPKDKTKIQKLLIKKGNPYLKSTSLNKLKVGDYFQENDSFYRVEAIAGGRIHTIRCYRTS